MNLRTDLAKCCKPISNHVEVGSRRKKMKNLYFVFAALALCACDKSDDGGVTMADARAAAKTSAGASAVDCGTIEIRASRADANCCFASNLAQSMPAFALYKIQGIDSVVAEAVSLKANGEVEHFEFGGNLGDFEEPVEGLVTRRVCNGAALADDACSNERDLPFSCSQ